MCLPFKDEADQTCGSRAPRSGRLDFGAFFFVIPSRYAELSNMYLC